MCDVHQARHSKQKAARTHGDDDVVHLPDSQPLATRAISEREDLRGEVVLLQLAAFAQIPGSDRVIEPSSPQLSAVRRDVNTGGAVSVALELAHELLVVQVPHSDVAVRAAAEANVRVGADGERVARGRRRGKLGLDARRRTAEVPDAYGARLAADDQRAAVGKQFA